MKSKTDVLAFRLDEDLSQRLTALSKATNRSKTFYAREALEQHIEDLEDYYLALEVKRGLEDGSVGVEDWDEFCAEIDAAAETKTLVSA